MNRNWSLWAMEPQRRRRRGRVRWLLAAFGLLAVLFAGAHARAEKPPAIVTTVPVVCMPAEDMRRMLADDLREREAWRSKTEDGADVVVYEGDADAWTVVVYVGEAACVIASREAMGERT